MAVTTDILRTWCGPRSVMRDLLAMGPREDRSIAYLMVACLLVFVAQWPRLVRTAELTGAEFDRLIAYEFMAWMMIWPLLFYVMAASMVLIMRPFGYRVPGHAARLALFWSFLAAAPMGLFYGLLTGLNGDSAATQLIGCLWIAAFLFFLIQSIREALSTPGLQS
jgi:hypothetical protein